jgi:DNA primase
MMRDRSEVDAIRGALSDPHDVARRLGLEGGKRQGAGGLLVRCPAHGDRTPSCSLTIGSDRTLRVRCFACDLSGDIFNLVAAVERLDLASDFPEVKRRAAELAHVVLRGEGSRPGAPRPLPPAAVQVVHDLGPTIASCSLDVDAKEAAAVAAYLDGRGLLDAARADGWGALDLQEVRYQIAERLALGDEPFDLARAGVARKCADGWMAMWPQHRLCIPWRDRFGRVTAVQRRRLDAGDPRYVTAGTTIDPYGSHRLASLGPDTSIAYVEGAIDALALGALDAREGVDRIALGIPGVAGWRPMWAELARGRRACIALDSDPAGDAAVPRLAADLQRAGALAVTRGRPVGGRKDLGELMAAGRNAS